MFSANIDCRLHSWHSWTHVQTRIRLMPDPILDRTKIRSGSLRHPRSSVSEFRIPRTANADMLKVVCISHWDVGTDMP